MDSLDAILSSLDDLLTRLQGWAATDLATPAMLAQIALLVAGLVLAFLLAGRLRRALTPLRAEGRVYARLAPYAEPLYAPLLALVLLGVAQIATYRITGAAWLLDVATSLLTAWLVIHLVAGVIRTPALRRLVAIGAWSVAALDIVGLLDPLTAMLDAARLPIGDASISALSVFNGALVFVLLIWGAILVARLTESRIDSLTDISASMRELAKKLARIGLIAAAFLLALNAAGIDLTALAVFSGALGVGLGFGLQKVVANFISGMILLLDRSIKPGDVIETQGTYGWINHLGARYTSIITRDGTEFLVPNEDMITQPVINWSFSDRKVRRKIPVQISYDADPREAMRIMEDAAKGVPRVLPDPAPAARLLGFGESGVDLELRVWIEDPQAGVINVASDIMLAIWDGFHAAGIGIPYPQRVVHFASSAAPPADGSAPER